jgi:hypothetical protein
MFHAELRPGHPGLNNVLVRLTDSAGQPIEAQSLEVRAENAAAGIAPIGRAGERVDPGAYAVRDLPLPAPGTWTLRFDVLVSDFEKLVFEAELEVR